MEGDPFSYCMDENLGLNPPSLFIVSTKNKIKNNDAPATYSFN
jgi:hypothetical protein